MSEMDKMTSGNLINAEKVHGTDVYNTQGEKLGEIEISSSIRSMAAFSMRFCRLAASWALATNATRCHGVL